MFHCLDLPQKRKHDSLPCMCFEKSSILVNIHCIGIVFLAVEKFFTQTSAKKKQERDDNGRFEKRARARARARNDSDDETFW